MGKALELAQGRASGEASRLDQLRDFLIGKVLEEEPRAQLTGHPTRRLPHIASFVLRGVDAEALLALLDHNSIGASTGSACTSAALEPSHVLTALGIRSEISRGSLRLFLGSGTTRKHVDYAVGILCRSVETLVGMAPEF